MNIYIYFRYDLYIILGYYSYCIILCNKLGYICIYCNDYGQYMKATISFI